MAQITATLAQNAIAAALAPTGHPHPLLADRAREHVAPTVPAPVTFEAIGYRLLEVGGDLEELADQRPDDIRLKAALTALEYAHQVIDAYAEAEAGE